MNNIETFLLFLKMSVWKICKILNHHSVLDDYLTAGKRGRKEKING